MDHSKSFMDRIEETLIAETFNGVYEMVIPGLVNGRPMWITKHFLTALQSHKNGSIPEIL